MKIEWMQGMIGDNFCDIDLFSLKLCFQQTWPRHTHTTFWLIIFWFYIFSNLSVKMFVKPIWERVYFWGKKVPTITDLCHQYRTYFAFLYRSFRFTLICLFIHSWFFHHFLKIKNSCRFIRKISKIQWWTSNRNFTLSQQTGDVVSHR